MRKALELEPRYPEALVNLGDVLHDQNRIEEAIACYQRAIEIRPDHASAYFGLGIALQSNFEWDAALAAYAKTLSFEPDRADVHNNIAIVYQNRGQLDHAIQHFRRSLQLRPDVAYTHSSLAMAMHYHSEISPDEIFQEHRRWNACFAAPVRRISHDPTERATRTPGQRLRIGYVSPDFRRHPVPSFLESLLVGHNRERVELFAYSNTVHCDDVTDRLRAHMSTWRDITRLSDDQAADLIAADGIDILVDLAGHTAMHRLGVFARKPAPVQVTWLGYPNTTGLDAIDYRLTDAYADPPGAEAYHSEALVRLPGCFLCYTPPLDSPAISRSAATDAVTFVSFNLFSKVTEKVLELWSRILLAVPKSKLFLKASGLRSETTRAKVSEIFRRCGVSSDRLKLSGGVADFRNHLNLYNHADIALDPFPYNGTTTSFEAAWMGIPMITLKGATHVSRVGVSLNSNLGLADLIAETPDDYVRIAVALAADPSRRASLHAGMRQRMTRSGLLDTEAFASKVEDAYQSMWANFLAGNAAT